MFQPYDDLHELAGYREPLWWDECGVPRWCEFEPREVNDIYASEVMLLEILCQCCGRRFRVAISQGIFGRRMILHDDLPYYGDAPCFAFSKEGMDQCAGSTMTSETVRILEHWVREGIDWVRQASKEARG